MIGIYLLCLVIFPAIVLYKIEILSQNKANVLMSKTDTQFLRGVSACFVVFTHFCAWVNEIQSLNKFFYFVISQLGGIGVLIFFFVSGYGIYESYADKAPNWDYLWKRAKSVYFPYLIIKFLLIIPKSIIERDISLGTHKLVSILLVEDWFVHVILIQYIVFFIIWKFLNVNRVILYSIIFDSVLSCVYIIEGKPDGWFNALWLFTFGMACSQYENKLFVFFKRRTWVKTFLLFGVFCIIGTFFAINKDSYWANPFKPIGGIFLCLAICGILRKLTFESRPMLYFGKCSMYLYIVHINVWPALQIQNVVYRFWIALILSMFLSGGIYTVAKFSIRNRKYIVENQRIK